MKKLLFILFALPLFTKAQNALLIVQGTTGNFYLNHTAAPKESFYSIGRLYNVSPKEIAPYNNIPLEKGFSIGQNIKIPLKSNFMQANSTAADEAAVPLYHKVEVKETLYQLSTRFDKVPVTSLKTWNNLQSDALSLGADLIVGYIKVKKELSALAQGNLATTPATTIIEQVKPKEQVIKKATVVTPIVKEQVKEVVKVMPTKKEVVKEVAAIKEPIKQAPSPTIVEEVEEADAKDFKGGVFKTLYLNTDAKQNGLAGVFKSTSGWDDGKYYCLFDAVQKNTIVKITNTANGKFVYAKVLDVMPDLKQNDNLQIRISNAAADILGAGLSNFECIINY